MHGFWTLTTYDDRQSLVDNPTDRYSIGDWNGLTLDPDGSLPVAIQHRRPPRAISLRNWLPAPPGRFNLLLRLIWPLHGGARPHVDAARRPPDRLSAARRPITRFGRCARRAAAP